jgi:hypothetical protein
MGLSQTTVFLPDFAFVMILKSRIYDFIPDLFDLQNYKRTFPDDFRPDAVSEQIKLTSGFYWRNFT